MDPLSTAGAALGITSLLGQCLEAFSPLKRKPDKETRALLVLAGNENASLKETMEIYLSTIYNLDQVEKAVQRSDLSMLSDVHALLSAYGKRIANFSQGMDQVSVQKRLCVS